MYFLPLHPLSRAYYCGHAKLGFSELGLLLVALFSSSDDMIIFKAIVCLNTA